MKKLILFIVLNSLIFKILAQNLEENFIRAVIEKETETWRVKDVKGHTDCWAIKPYGRILVSTEDGKAFDLLPTDMVDVKAEMMGFEGKSVNSNYKISINGTIAWMSYNQVKIAPNGQKNYSYEMRMLEKVKNQWKILGMSVHHYKP